MRNLTTRIDVSLSKDFSAWGQLPWVVVEHHVHNQETHVKVVGEHA
jgi:hypothetical protein